MSGSACIGTRQVSGRTVSVRDLRPEKSHHRVLISTTSRLTGEFNSAELLITHAFPGFQSEEFQNFCRPSSTVRQSLVVVHKTSYESQDVVSFSRDQGFAEDLTAYLSVLFGKRFDNHGDLQHDGYFFMPDTNVLRIPCNQSLPFTSNAPRRGLEIPLDLSEGWRIAPLLTPFKSKWKQKHISTLGVACRFYAQALRSYEFYPELAYLHLITAGEVLSSGFRFRKQSLLDDNAKHLIGQIQESCDQSEVIARKVYSRLFQVKATFTRALKAQLNSFFFSHSESNEAHFRLTNSQIERRIGAAYDLRSKYLHSGVEFGTWVKLFSAKGAEVVPGKPVTSDKEMNRILERAPTFIGLERIIRYSLLKRINDRLTPIDHRLSRRAS